MVAGGAAGGKPQRGRHTVCELGTTSTKIAIQGGKGMNKRPICYLNNYRVNRLNSMGMAMKLEQIITTTATQ